MSEKTLVDQLIDASASGDVKLGLKLISVGTDVNGRQLAGGHTPLVTAAFNGQVAFMEMLLQNGAVIDLASNDGTTPRDWAIKSKKIDTVAFIDSWGRTDAPYLAREKNYVITVTRMGKRTLEETFNFASRERISVLCANPGAPAETMLREPFSAIEDQSGIEKAFALYKEYGGKLTVDDVFSDRIFKAKMPKIGGLR
jgi:hypothetical protein